MSAHRSLFLVTLAIVLQSLAKDGMVHCADSSGVIPQAFLDLMEQHQRETANTSSSTNQPLSLPVSTPKGPSPSKPSPSTPAQLLEQHRRETANTSSSTDQPLSLPVSTPKGPSPSKPSPSTPAQLLEQHRRETANTSSSTNQPLSLPFSTPKGSSPSKPSPSTPAQLLEQHRRETANTSSSTNQPLSLPFSTPKGSSPSKPSPSTPAQLQNQTQEAPTAQELQQYQQIIKQRQEELDRLQQQLQEQKLKEAQEERQRQLLRQQKIQQEKLLRQQTLQRQAQPSQQPKSPHHPSQMKPPTALTTQAMPLSRIGASNKQGVTIEQIREEIHRQILMRRLKEEQRKQSQPQQPAVPLPLQHWSSDMFATQQGPSNFPAPNYQFKPPQVQPTPPPRPVVATTRTGVIDFVPREHKPAAPVALHRGSPTHLSFGGGVPPEWLARQIMGFPSSHFAKVSPFANMPLSRQTQTEAMNMGRQMCITQFYESHGCIDPVMYLPPGTSTHGLMMGCSSYESQSICTMAGSMIPGIRAGTQNNRGLAMMMQNPSTKALLEKCLTPNTVIKFMTKMFGGAGGSSAGGMNPAAMMMMMGGEGGGMAAMAMMNMMKQPAAGAVQSGQGSGSSKGTSSSLPEGAALPLPPPPPAGQAASGQATGQNREDRCLSVLPMIIGQGGEGIMSPDTAKSVRDLRQQMLPYTCQDITQGVYFRMCCPGKVPAPSMMEMMTQCG